MELIEDKIIDQAWLLFEKWFYYGENTEKYSQAQLTLFRLLKESNPAWSARFKRKSENSEPL